MNRGAIILCGGASSRMSRDKALLPFGKDEVLLQRVVRLVAQGVPAERIVCVAAADQSLPTLPNFVQIACDPEPQQGPLAGLATGLGAMASHVDAVFACGCDVPLLVPAFVERLFKLLGDKQVAVPRIDGRLHPLAAVYRPDVLPIVRSLLANGERSLHALVEHCDARFATADELRDVDPEFATLIGCNTPDEYRAALERISPSP